jgi:transcriptional regulator with XRE-family HTH domain
MAKLTPHTTAEREQIARFVNCLNQAMVAGRLSQRQLCERIGITIGSLTKYLRGAVAPLRVGTGIQAALAKELGVTLDALVAYYVHGHYVTEVSVEAVESWIRSEAGQEDLPRLMASLTDAGQRWMTGAVDVQALPPAPEVQRYTWPIEELRDCGVSDKWRERMGLSDEVLERLAVSGEFDEEVAEAFGIACNYDTEAVIEAFRKREAIA